jgi:hypothetical protein
MSIQHCEDCGDELTIQLWKKAENLAVSFSTTLYCAYMIGMSFYVFSYARWVKRGRSQDFSDLKKLRMIYHCGMFLHFLLITVHNYC